MSTEQLPLAGIPQPKPKPPTAHIVCKGINPRDANVTLDDGRALCLRALQLNMHADHINEVVCDLYDFEFDVDAVIAGWYARDPLTGSRKRVKLLEFFEPDPQEMPDIIIADGELVP